MCKKYSMILLLFFLLAMTLTFTACANSVTDQSEETTMATTEPAQTEKNEDLEEKTETTESEVVVNTGYIPLSYSDVYADVLSHQEIVSDGVTMEIFSMQVSEKTMELFRICFGDENFGIMAGYLNLDGAEVPVTYTICQYGNEEFADEDTRALYLETMNSFNDLMHSIQKDNRFSEDKVIAPVESMDVSLSYWTFSLPETMEYEENNVNGQYEIRFYGNVAGERIALYTVFLGGTSASTVLGTYNLNGEEYTLSVESYNVEPMPSWTNEETASVYTMMGTVNDVLQTIMSSENYKEYRPE